MRYSWLVWLLVVLSIGCGVAARPLSKRGATVEAGAAAASDPSQSAWFRCFGRRDYEVSRVTVVARYRSCSIIVATERESFEWGNMVPLWLGPAQNLKKVDTAVLVKALARFDTLHLVVRPRPADASAEIGYPSHPDLHEQVACSARGMAGDFDCPPEAVALLLAHPEVAEVVVWNRFWVHWK